MDNIFFRIIDFNKKYMNIFKLEVLKEFELSAQPKMNVIYCNSYLFGRIDTSSNCRLVSIEKNVEVLIYQFGLGIDLSQVI